MKKQIKTLLGLALSVILVFSVVSVAFAEAKPHYTTEIPTVYLAGQGTNLWNVPGYDRSESFYPLEIPDGYIGDAGKTLIAPLFKGIATDDWEEYCDILSDAIIGIVGVLGLDGNGEAKPEDHAWANNPNKDNKTADGKYTIYCPSFPGDGYHFNYDWRTDPFSVVEELNAYIEAVKKKTGAEKVNLAGRCLGANIALAYLAEHGSDAIEKTVLVSAGFEGFSALDALFTGELKFDADSLTRFANEYLSSGENSEDPMLGFLDIIIRLLNQAQALGMPLSLVDKFGEKVFPTVIPRVLRASYGSMPSYWAFVSDEKYEAAKQYVFGGYEEEYAGLIEKIDRYREEIAPNYKQIIDDANAAGNRVSIISKYGLQLIPITGDNDIMADGYLETSSSSFGATTSKIDGTLSKAYLAEAKENGTDRYISIDRQIDASTCAYPEYTWFIKNMPHMENPDCMNEIICAILDFDGDMTVFDDEAFPQFLYCSGIEADDTLSPLSKENSSSGKVEIFADGRLNSLIEILLKLIRMLFGLLTKAIA